MNPSFIIKNVLESGGNRFHGCTDYAEILLQNRTQQRICEYFLHETIVEIHKWKQNILEMKYYMKYQTTLSKRVLLYLIKDTRKLTYQQFSITVKWSGSRAFFHTMVHFTTYVRWSTWIICSKILRPWRAYIYATEFFNTLFL